MRCGQVVSSILSGLFFTTTSLVPIPSKNCLPIDNSVLSELQDSEDTAIKYQH